MFIKKKESFLSNLYNLLKKQKFKFSHYIEGKNDNFRKQINEEYERIQRNIPLNENDIFKIRNVMIRIGNDKRILSNIIHTYNIPSFFLLDKDVRNHFLNYIKNNISYADQLRNGVLMNNDVDEKKDDNFLNIQDKKYNNDNIKQDNSCNILNLYDHTNQNYSTTAPNQIYSNNNNNNNINGNNNYCYDKPNVDIRKEKLKRSDEIIMNILLIFIKKYYYKQWMFYEHIKRLCDYREIMLYIMNKNKKHVRNIYLYVGPPNSGKTYHAFQKLLVSKNGLYCSPLRLLAWEIYSKLTGMNKQVNLLTGQEVIIKNNQVNENDNNRVNEHYNNQINENDNNRVNEHYNNHVNEHHNNQVNEYHNNHVNEHHNVSHTVCTIEMTPLNKKYDCAIVDEIQMINNELRGYAWTNVLMNLNCKDIYLCGSEYIIDLIKNLADIFNDQLFIKKFERLGSLQLLEYNTTLEDVETGDCIITFSRNNIMLLKKILEKNNKRVFVIYGSLPPDSKKKQINLFNQYCKDDMDQTKEIITQREQKHNQHNIYLLYEKKIEEYKIKINNYKQRFNKHDLKSNMNKYYDSISYYKNILRKYFHCVKKYTYHQKNKTTKKKQTVLIATDVIGMGLNINIKRIIFYSLKKYDGDILRYLTISEFLQIAGRAGRFNPSSENKSIGYITCIHIEDIEILKTIFKHKYINSLNYISTGDLQEGKKELNRSHSDSLHNINNLLNIQYSTLLEIYNMIKKERAMKEEQMETSIEMNDIYSGDNKKLKIIKNMHNNNNNIHNNNDGDNFICTLNFTNNYKAKAGFFPQYYAVEELRKTLEYEYNSKIKLHEILKILVDYVRLNDEYFFLTKNYNNMITITKELEHINLEPKILFTYSLCPININNIILLNTLKTFCMCHSILGYVDFFHCVNNNIFSHVDGNKYFDLLNNETNSNNTANHSISYSNIQRDTNVKTNFINQYDGYVNENVINNINYIDHNNNNKYDISTNSFYFNKKIDIDNNINVNTICEHNQGEIKGMNTQINNDDNIIHIDEYTQLLEMYYEMMDMYCWLYTKFPDVYKNINLVTNEKKKVSMKIIHMLTHTFKDK
ncbi:ATP dependent DEAD-box helicase, putative [Plasmodium sp. gorilla clade G2]|uniref:ATP dependent DEAD-box helicase, putative n=1 Tax=Plasmodium sp. gorilla clade G2 TaxID=880535 RepID=UPI000D213513|nr:ATP dependent DEAD-box helicase, putative [Plasmodium sp. gorilla clade G2]SOV12646.1 ATP dependent DEAD-box helicase, putative [Plasmodium sp. gorilla clade G2]